MRAVRSGEICLECHRLQRLPVLLPRLLLPSLRLLRLLPDAESSSSLPPRENTLDNRSEARLSALPGGRGAAPF